MTSYRLLVISGESQAAKQVGDMLQAADLVVDLLHASTVQQSHALLKRQAIDAILVWEDWSRPVTLRLPQEVRQKGWQIPLIALMDTDSLDVAQQILAAGADEYLLAAELSPGRLARTIQQALHVHEINYRAMQTEVALRRYARELEQRNEELDSFSGMVAHNLKNTLHPILGMAQLLIADHEACLDSEGRFLVDCIVRSADKGVQVIEALLRLSRLRHEQPTLVRLNMDAIVQEVLQHLEHQIKESGARVDLPDQWPAVMGYHLWIEEVWLNYLSNALKYGGQPPELKLGSQQDGDVVRFWVRDNGAGLKPSEQERLFLPFSRLSTGRSDSHGLGLATTRRIIEKLGGDTGVESTLNEGSTFWFTLPTTSHPNR